MYIDVVAKGTLKSLGVNDVVAFKYILRSRTQGDDGSNKKF